MRSPRVALLVESSRGYGRGLLEGISGYAHAHGPWSISWQDRGLETPVPDWFLTWRGDGVIARIETPEMRAAIRRTGAPVVDLRVKFRLRAPQIDTDNAMVSAVAIEHLRARGFRSLAFCGFGDVEYSEQRRRAFEKIVRAEDVEYHVYPPPPKPGRRRTPTTDQPSVEQDGILFEDALADWVESLPRPTGVLACNDLRAQQFLNACRTVGVAVPDDIAVVGVDDDTLLCNLCEPPLSSVVPDTFEIGYRAAGLLERLMRGESVDRRRILVPPKGIVTRQSTDVLAIEDEDVAQAVRFIRERACDGIKVEDVARAVAVSRATLNRRFEAIVGRSPKREIVRVRIERARQMLIDTNLTQDQIARRCGFHHAEYMHVVFRRELGRTPGNVRRRDEV